MNATSLYVSVSQMVFKMGFDDDFQGIVEVLNIQIPQLRLLLGCAVCASLVVDPFIAQNRACDHNVCRVCLMGKKSLQPSCPNCNELRGFTSYIEDGVKSRLVQCYKSLCEHISESRLLPFLNSSPEMQTIEDRSSVVLVKMSVQDIVREGAQNDNFSVFSADISSNSTLEALEAASSSAAQRLRQYQKSKNPDLVFSDEEDEKTAIGNNPENLGNELNEAPLEPKNENELNDEPPLDETSHQEADQNVKNEMSSENDLGLEGMDLHCENENPNNSGLPENSLNESYIEEPRGLVSQNQYESELENFSLDNNNFEDDDDDDDVVVVEASGEAKESSFLGIKGEEQVGKDDQENIKPNYNYFMDLNQLGKGSEFIQNFGN